MVPLVISPEVVPPVQDDPSSRIPFGYTEGAASQGVFEVFFLPFLESRRVSGPPSMVAVATQFPHKYGLGALGRDAELRGTDNFHGLYIGLGPATGPTGVFVAVLFPVPPDVLLIVLILGRREQALKFAVICSIASIAGGFVGYSIGHFIWWDGTNYNSFANFFFNNIPGFTEALFQKIQNQYNHYGFIIIFTAGFTPIPFKVFTISAGAFDISFLRCIPNMVIMTPSNENIAWKMLNTGFDHQGPASIRYPRGSGPGFQVEKDDATLQLGKSTLIKSSGDKKISIMNFGSTLKLASEIADDFDASLFDMNFVKPLDQEKILQLAKENKLLVTIEENVVKGGAGSAVVEFLAENNQMISILNFGISDEFVQHGSPDHQKVSSGLGKEEITEKIRKRLDQL